MNRPTKCPAREKKNESRKAKKSGEGEKAKSKSQDCCVTAKPKNNREFFAFCACPNFVS